MRRARGPRRPRLRAARRPARIGAERRLHGDRLGAMSVPATSSTHRGIDSERELLERVPRQLYIRGQWREASAGGTLTVEDPATGEALVEVADARARGCSRRARRRERGAGGVGRAPAARARRDPAPRLRGDDRACRRARAADDARDGQGARRVARRDHLRGRVPALVLRGGGAHPRPLHGRPQRQGPGADDAPAGRAVRVRDALELPHRDGHAQDRPRDRRGLHDGRQARAADAAVDARARADPRAGGAAAGGAERDHRQALRAKSSNRC